MNETILVDCFDTIISRKIHPILLLKQWDMAVARKYPRIPEGELYKMRRNLQGRMNIAIEGVEQLYKAIAELCLERKYIVKNDQQVFMNSLFEFEKQIEMINHCVKKRIVRLLKREKENGKRIYCVTDIHFNSNTIKEFFCSLGISNLFDGVFSSADFGKTKEDGNLYHVVLNTLSITPSQCIMIGDNQKSDIQNAKLAGIKTKYTPSLKAYFQKIRFRLNKDTAYTVSKTVIKRKGYEIIRKSDQYEEFSVIFFVFIIRLYNELLLRKARSVVFLAREGFYLKKLFDRYQELCVPDNLRIKTQYFLCSRRSIYSVNENSLDQTNYKSISIRNYFKSIGFDNEDIEDIDFDGLNIDEVIDDFSTNNMVNSFLHQREIQELIKKHHVSNRKAFNAYIKQFDFVDKIYLVDVGWFGRMQNMIQQLTGLDTEGFYFGTYPYNEEEGPIIPFNIKRNGLILSSNNNGVLSFDYHYLRVNTQFDEQFMAAPHGGACFYYFENGTATARLEWDENEELVYKNTICHLQKRIMNHFEDLCLSYYYPQADNSERFMNSFEKNVTKQIACVSLRSALLQSRARLQFMKKIAEGFSRNFRQTSSGLKYAVIPKVKILRFFTNPDEYVRYIAKVGYVLYGKWYGWVRIPIMLTAYLYTKMIGKLKGHL